MLADQKVDVETLVAAILHDTIEDTPLTREQLAAEFGETVAELVDGVTSSTSCTQQPPGGQPRLPQDDAGDGATCA